MKVRTGFVTFVGQWHAGCWHVILTLCSAFTEETIISRYNVTQHVLNTRNHSWQSDNCEYLNLVLSFILCYFSDYTKIRILFAWSVLRASATPSALWNAIEQISFQDASRSIDDLLEREMIGCHVSSAMPQVMFCNLHSYSLSTNICAMRIK